ncbi:MAG: hypothetical protein HY395_01640 [Candidatus Doudnabacteria bacterium]|nr:hypothetical protein [Candidatus Doudnabacteria bacterium]
MLETKKQTISYFALTFILFAAVLSAQFFVTQNADALATYSTCGFQGRPEVSGLRVTVRVGGEANITTPIIRIIWGDGEVDEKGPLSAPVYTNEVFTHDYRSAGDYRITHELDAEDPCDAKTDVTVTAPASTGNIKVKSNKSTNWDINGPESMSGSGTSKQYNDVSVSPPEYCITAGNIPGYSLSINDSCQTLNAGDTITFDLTYNAITTPTGSISVSTNKTSSWVVSGPANFSGSGGPGTYTYDTTKFGTYSASAGSISGYSVSVSPSSATLSEGNSISFTITYTSNSDPNPDPGDGGGGASCSPNSQSVQVNTNASLQASGGSGYTWSAPGGSPASGSGRNFTTRYASTGTKTVTLRASGGESDTCTVNVTREPPPPDDEPEVTCTDDATAVFTEALPSSMVAGQTYTFKVNVTNTGNTWWYHGDVYRLRQRSSLDLNPNTGKMSDRMDVGENEIWRFTLTAPGTPGNYTLTMQMRHESGNDYIRDEDHHVRCDAPASDTYFGQQVTKAFTVTAAPLAPLAAPVLDVIDNSVCARLTLNWTDANSGENGFKILRSTDGTNFGQIDDISPNRTTYTDTPPATDTRYYYIVRVYKNNPYQETDSNIEDALNRICGANLSNSRKTIKTVNGQEYTSSTIIQDNDNLTFQIKIRNDGTTAATINYVDDILSSNIINPRNPRIDKDNDGNYNEQSAQENISISGSAPNIRLNVSGSKAVGDPDWFIRFDATFNAATSDLYETLSNTATINFTDPNGTQNLTKPFGPILVRTGAPKPPDFREVAP